MANLSIAFCRQLARARRAKGMTQSALADAVGCKQSALSMLEAGHAAKVAHETVERSPRCWRSRWKRQPRGALPVLRPDRREHPRLLSACRLFFQCALRGERRAALLAAAQADGRAAAAHCAVCGELLERCCPHCGAPVVTAGACCPACGGERVANTLPPETDCEPGPPSGRRAIAEWRSLIL
jgi:DNA-binding XRE family transcriptional regulator